MRLIDADAVCTECSEHGICRGDAWDCIVGQATTVDAVEVVRCKDCEFYSQRFGGACTYHNADPYEMPGFQPNGFCSYGIRRDGGQQDG